MLALDNAAPSTCPDPESLTVFQVTGLPEIAVLARVIEVFALRSLLPRSVACDASTEAVQITLALGGVDDAEAERLAERLRQIVIVDQVAVQRRPVCRR